MQRTGSIRVLAPALLALAAAAATPVAFTGDPSGGAPPADRDVRELFVLHCAPCHGETGDGKGTTPLERPARSFLDGGFSYGNTPKAVLRTIANGIPGTPMPGFDVALDLETREAMAAYVIGLGPEQKTVEPSEMVLSVAERPVVARGLLPPIVEGAPKRPRGLLIGTTTGATFEYRVDDVRLLGIRQGGFVERRDWVGRGGDALQPLGKLVYVFGKGNPRAPFRIEFLGDTREPEDLTARLAGTWIQEEGAGLDYRLVSADGVVLGTVSESVRSASTSVGAGFRRTFKISALVTAYVRARLHDVHEGDIIEDELIPGSDGDVPRPTVHRSVSRGADGLYRVVLVKVQSPNMVEEASAGGLLLRFENLWENEIQVTAISTHEWSDQVREQLVREALR